MKKWLTRALIVVLILMFGGAGAIAYALHRAQERMDRRIQIAAYTVDIPTNAEAIERGKYLFSTRGCVDCHGADGAGRVFVDDGSIRIKGPNISPGPGSVVAQYTPADWERALRHGVKPDGRPLMVMPSEDYNRLTDGDAAAIASYVKSLPPVAGGPAVLQLPLPVRALYGFGLMPDAASKIDHALPPAQPVAEGVTVEHGRYVANMCIGCHGATLAGGRIPGGPPDWPAAADLRPGAQGVMARYGEADALLQMFRSGRRPDGSVVRVMPFEALGKLNDTDARALHLYLKSLGGAAS